MQTARKSQIDQDVHESKDEVKRERIVWSADDKLIIISAFQIYDLVKTDFSENEIDRSITKTSKAHPKQRQSLSHTVQVISGLFFDALISPSRLYDCRKANKIDVKSEEAWRYITSLFKNGHTFGTSKIEVRNIIVDTDERMYNKFVELGVKYRSEYCRTIQTKNNSEKSDKEIRGRDAFIIEISDESPREDHDRPQELISVYPGHTPIGSLEEGRESRPILTPVLEEFKEPNSPVKTAAKRDNSNLDLEIPFKKRKEFSSTILTEVQNEPIGVISSEPQNRTPFLDRALIIKQILTRLKINDNISEMNWKWVAHDKEENVELIKAIWEDYLMNIYESRFNKNSDEPLMIFFESEISYNQGYNNVNWKWIAEGLSTNETKISAEQCQLKWQNEVYMSIQNI